ncbi:hypothetical protein HanIR_Chr11g0549011 [Helianthus annuus]|nr:hypothetical protein HanIR_Chr11g0549011 [Helianthus annuus]
MFIFVNYTKTFKLITRVLHQSSHYFLPLVSRWMDFLRWYYAPQIVWLCLKVTDSEYCDGFLLLLLQMREIGLANSECLYIHSPPDH